MQFLADESCDFRVVVELRKAGNDVLAVAEKAPGSPDRGVIEIARKERRSLLTEDRDFGRLVFADRVEAGAGVLYIRCPERFRPELPHRISRFVAESGHKLAGSFVVWTPVRVRFRRMPARPGQ